MTPTHGNLEVARGIVDGVVLQVEGGRRNSVGRARLAVDSEADHGL